MSITVGIDLGTTNSCVAVPADADIPGKQELITAGRLRPAGGALIITDAYQAPITPSVVWLGEDGAPVVGSLAKSKVKHDGQPPPAMFFKRTMGTDQRVTAGHADLSPQQASTHVLRHLKALAEEVLRVPVDQAVVTVPAYFEMRAKNETVQAGLDAGLAKVETLIEPFAAALTSTHGQRMTEPRTFLVYDLGGGTFDVSVVAWTPEAGFEHLAFEGDRYLGGYEFDKAIVRWMAEQRPAYDLRLEPDHPDEARLLARLLVRVESEKHFLSREQQTEIYVEGEADRAGIPMTIKLPFSRAEFEDLIQDDVQRTLAHCDAALQRAGLGPADLDEIIMVGGSSRVPLISRLLRERYGHEPRLIDPDLCVAVGAGIKARTTGVRQGILEIDHVAATLPATDIAGRVHPDAGTAAPGGLQVLLRSGDGVRSHRQQTDAEGRFVFEDIALHDGDNELTITVVADGEEIESRRLTVSPDHQPPPTDEGDVLAHDFFVELEGGPHRIAQAGTKLPYHTSFPLETAGQGVMLRVRLDEGLIPIGEVAVHDLPGTLPAGTPVELELEFRPDWSIDTEVSVPAVGMRGRALITVPREHVPSWEELRQRYLEIGSGWQERRAVARPEDAMRIGPQLDAILRECERLLDQRQDRAKCHHRLRETRTLLDRVRLPAADAMHPPLPEFENKLADLASLCDQLARTDATEAQQHRESIPGLRAAGLAAYRAGNGLDWHSINQAVEDRCVAVHRKLMPGQPPPSPANLQLELYRELQTLDGALRDIDRSTQGKHRGRAEEFLAEVAALVSAVGGVDANDVRSTERFAAIHRNEVQPLAARIERWMEEVHGGSPGEIPIRRRRGGERQ
ncbi:MAG: Hsp70 family protein [Streptomyces sp.]|nr:Hsp70 family protein [Streptomyces sp.]